MATILVVEDEVILRMNLSDYLRGLGLQVVEAANASEARKILGAVESVDLVVSDVHMAEENEGLDLAGWMAVHHPAIPVILTSGSASVEKARAWEVWRNVVEFVPKPYEQQAMGALIGACLAARTTRRI